MLAANFLQQSHDFIARQFTLCYNALGLSLNNIKLRDELEIAFAEKELRNLCQNGSHCKNVLGAKVAEALKHRLSDLIAATSLNDLIAGNLREVHSSKQRYAFAVNLAANSRLVFTPNHRKTPKLSNGNIDRQKISRIKILEIVT